MACTPSGLGAGSGAAAAPPTMLPSAKPSSCALCSATSSTRATTCVVPARLVVGVRISVSPSAVSAQSLQQLVDDHLGRRPIDLEHQHARIRAVAVAEFGEQFFLDRQRARRARTEREELLATRFLLAGRQAPAGVLAAQAGEHRLRTAALRARWASLPARRRARPRGRGRPCRSRRPQAGCDAAASPRCRHRRCRRRSRRGAPAPAARRPRRAAARRGAGPARSR